MMESKFSMHGTSLVRHLSSKSVSVFVFLTIYFYNVSCANIPSSRGNHSVFEESENDSNVRNNSSFSHRQSLAQVLSPTTHLNYINNPAAFGFPHFPFGLPLQQPIPTHIPLGPLPASGPNQSNKKRVTSKGVTVKSTNDNVDKTNSTREKETLSKESSSEEGNSLEKVEGKASEESERGCPGCISGTCDAHLDPNTNISGIPVIQIIIGAFAGIFWAGIFLFILKNFKDNKSSGGGYGGYGGYDPSPSPQYGYDSQPQEYGPPQSEYGAPSSSYGSPSSSYGSPSPSYGSPSSNYGSPSSSYGTPSSSYGTNRISFSDGNGRASGGYTFNELSSWVLKAVDKLIKAYDD